MTTNGSNAALLAAELRALMARATPGVWLAGTGGGGGATTYVYDETDEGAQGSAIAAFTLDLVERPFSEREANAQLTALMHTALPTLLTAIEQGQGRVEA